MGPWKPQYTIALIVAGLLACSVCYFVGRKQGVIDAKLAENHTQTVKQDSVTRIDSAKVDTAHKHSDIIGAYRAKVRAKVGVSHDTITVHDSVAVVSPEIAQLIEADDSTIAAQSRTIALQDTLISSLRVGIQLRDTRIHLLESEVAPSKVKKVLTAAKWVLTGAVIGVAYSNR